MNLGTAAVASPNVKSTETHQSAPSPVWLIVKREFGHYLGTKFGYLVSAGILLVAGLFFNAQAIGNAPKYSADVLSSTFEVLGGVVMFAANFFAMRLFAEERQTGTLVLLHTSPLTEWRLVIAKFLAGFLFLALLIAFTAYMPALIFLRGQVSLGHLASGYLGVLMIGAATMAVGTFASAIAQTQIAAIILSGIITVGLIVLWMVGGLIEGPLGEVVGYLALWNKHFPDFSNGLVSLSSIVFYLSITIFFLLLARNTLEARRWRS